MSVEEHDRLASKMFRVLWVRHCGLPRKEFHLDNGLLLVCGNNWAVMQRCGVSLRLHEGIWRLLLSALGSLRGLQWRFR